MAPAVFTFTHVPAGLLDLLSVHLPFSLPLLRRLQSTKWKGGRNPSSRILFAADDGEPPQNADANRGRHFAAAYLDPAAGPETQMWMYSTLEDGGLSPQDIETASRLVESVASQSQGIGREYSGELAYPNGILIGSLHSSVKKAMEATGSSFGGRSEYGYDKWLFKVDELPPADLSLPDGMYWSPATREDCLLVTSRTHLPRQPYDSLVAFCISSTYSRFKGYFRSNPQHDNQALRRDTHRLGISW